MKTKQKRRLLSPKTFQYIYLTVWTSSCYGSQNFGRNCFHHTAKLSNLNQIK